MTTTLSSNTIKPIVNIKFVNTFQKYNVTKQHQHVHKHTGHKYQYITFQISNNLSPPYLKEIFLGVELKTMK